MSWITNEFLFYGGIILTGCSVLAAIVYFTFSKVKSIKLNAQLNMEYGEKENR